ncbi:unnamed protein product, partial [Ectocarpus fasciculatus]
CAQRRVLPPPVGRGPPVRGVHPGLERPRRERNGEDGVHGGAAGLAHARSGAVSDTYPQRGRAPSITPDGEQPGEEHIRRGGGRAGVGRQ